MNFSFSCVFENMPSFLLLKTIAVWTSLSNFAFIIQLQTFFDFLCPPIISLLLYFLIYPPLNKIIEAIPPKKSIKMFFDHINHETDENSSSALRQAQYRQRSNTAMDSSGSLECDVSLETADNNSSTSANTTFSSSKDGAGTNTTITKEQVDKNMSERKRKTNLLEISQQRSFASDNSSTAATADSSEADSDDLNGLIASLIVAEDNDELFSEKDDDDGASTISIELDSEEWSESELDEDYFTGKTDNFVTTQKDSNLLAQKLVHPDEDEEDENLVSDNEDTDEVVARTRSTNYLAPDRANENSDKNMVEEENQEVGRKQAEKNKDAENVSEENENPSPVSSDDEFSISSLKKLSLGVRRTNTGGSEKVLLENGQTLLSQTQLRRKLKADAMKNQIGGKYLAGTLGLFVLSYTLLPTLYHICSITVCAPCCSAIEAYERRQLHNIFDGTFEGFSDEEKLHFEKTQTKILSMIPKMDKKDGKSFQEHQAMIAQELAGDLDELALTLQRAKDKREQKEAERIKNPNKFLDAKAKREATPLFQIATDAAKRAVNGEGQGTEDAATT